MIQKNLNNGALRAVNYTADLVTLSLLWLVCSFPVLTVGMTSAALFHTYEKVLIGKEGRVILVFFRSCKDNLRIALPIGAVLTLMNAALLFFWWESTREGSPIPALPIVLSLLLLLSIQCYFYPLTGHYCLNGKQAIALSMRMAFAHFPQTLLLLALQAVCAAAVILSPPLVVILPAAETALAEKVLMPLFRRYIRIPDASVPDAMAE